MAAILQKLSLTAGGATYFFLGRYSSIEPIIAEIGLALAAAADKEKPNVSIAEILRSGAGERFNVSYTKGGKTQQGRIVVSADKAQTAPAALVGQEFNGGKIVGVNRGRKSYPRN